MSLVSVLGKVALGAIAAKGVGSLISGQRGGGLASALGGLMGGGQQGGGALGALSGLLGGQGGGGSAASALSGLLGGQGGGGAASALSGLLGGGQQGGGSALSGLLGSLGQQSGGLGGLLDSLGGGSSGGGLGAMLNQALQGQTPETTPDQEKQAEIMLRAMISAAKADGKIDEEEQRKITEHLGDDVTPEEMEIVRSAMEAPVDVEQLAASVPAGMEQQVYLMSLLAIDLDAQSEAQYLDQLAKALNISPEQANAIHEKLGAPKLYG